MPFIKIKMYDIFYDMAYHKIIENEYTKNRFFKDGRLFIKINCSICKQERTIRYDHYNERFLKKGLIINCKGCHKVKRDNYHHSYGYVIRNYKSFPLEKWDIFKKMCKSNGQIKEHRAIVAIFLNRPLNDNEIIHHKNGIRNDNRLDNLELCILRQPPGQRLNDLIEENKKLHAIIKKNNICL